MDQLYAMINNYQQIIAECDRKIAFLKPVYKTIGDIKGDFRSVRKSTEELFEEKGIWRGEKYTSYCQAGDTIDGICEGYYGRLDAAHDAINSKIHELEAEKARLFLLIGELFAQIEMVKAAIENARN